MTFSRFSLIPAVLTGAMILWAAAMSMNGFSIQEPTTGEQQLPPRVSGQTYRVSVDLVNILCSVLDRKTNAFLTNLSREDFTIYEDGVKQEIVNFARETNLPITFALLVDTSQSVAPKLKFEQEAAINFIQSTMRVNDRAMLIEFSSGVTLLQDFTGDPNKRDRTLRRHLYGLRREADTGNGQEGHHHSFGWRG